MKHLKNFNENATEHGMSLSGQRKYENPLDFEMASSQKQETKLVLELSETEAQGLLNCIVTTSASGSDLDIGEMIEEKLREFLEK